MIFIDASAWIAYLVKRDEHHRRAVEAWPRLSRNGRLFTSNFVLDEALTYIADRAGYSYAVVQGRRIYSSAIITILRPDESIELRALELFEKYADQEIGFTDCISFALMTANGIGEAFAFDRHFERAQFTLFPGHP